MTSKTPDRHEINREWVEHMTRLNEKHGIPPAADPLPDRPPPVGSDFNPHPPTK